MTRTASILPVSLACLPLAILPHASGSQEPARPVAAAAAPLVAAETPAARPSMVWADYDRDGLEDAYLVRADGTARLLHNDGRSFADVTALVGLDAAELPAAASWQDVDGDAWPDLFAFAPRGNVRFFRNDRGSFRDETGTSGLAGLEGVVDLRWHDADGDGLADLHVVTVDGHRMLHNAFGAGGGFEPLALPESVTNRTATGTEAPIVVDRAPEASTPTEAARSGRTSATTATEAPATARLNATFPNPPPPQYVGGTPQNILDCVDSMNDVGGGACVQASSIPTLGMLYPLGLEFFIDAVTGNVGIGTTTPSTKLDVVGGLRVEGNLVLADPALEGGGGTILVFADATTQRTGMPDNIPDRMTANEDDDDDRELRIAGIENDGYGVGGWQDRLNDIELITTNLSFNGSVLSAGTQVQVEDRLLFSEDFGGTLQTAELDLDSSGGMVLNTGLTSGPMTLSSGGQTAQIQAAAPLGSATNALRLNGGELQLNEGGQTSCLGLGSTAINASLQEALLADGFISQKTSSGGTAYGSYGSVSGPGVNAYGLYGTVESSSASTELAGVYGRATTTGSGVQGFVDGGTGAGQGVLGATTSTNVTSAGVRGEAMSGGRGVVGEGTVGVYGIADTAGGVGMYSEGRLRAVDTSSGTPILQADYMNTILSDTVAVQGNSTPGPFYGIGVRGQGGYIGVSAISTVAGTGSRYGVRADANNGTNNFALYGSAFGGSNNYGIYATASGGSSWAGFFQGAVEVNGTLSKAGGSFKIDHPLDPANKYLYHSFVESPEMMNVYNGNATLNERGEAWVELPDYFEALNRDFRYQLTAIGRPAPDLYVAREVSGNSFKIAGGPAGGRVSWQVTGVRQDKWAEANRIEVEVDKAADDRGFFLHPEAHGAPAERGIDAARFAREEDAKRLGAGTQGEPTDAGTEPEAEAEAEEEPTAAEPTWTGATQR